MTEMDRSMQRYADNLKRQQAAQSYSTKYQRQWHKRLSDRRERAVIQKALALLEGPLKKVLDMPCGAGRLTNELFAPGREVVGVDYSEAQLAICREAHKGQSFSSLQASCFELPFEDSEFDLAFSVRLSHHIADDAKRAEYLRELMRVSRRYVIATFFDSQSLKNRLRELRRVFGSGKRSKYTMSLARLDEIAAEQGWVRRAALPISWMFSGHKYVVFECLEGAR